VTLRLGETLWPLHFCGGWRFDLRRLGDERFGHCGRGLHDRLRLFDRRPGDARKFDRRVVGGKPQRLTRKHRARYFVGWLDPPGVRVPAQ
jgi:hypothetical protein